MSVEFITILESSTATVSIEKHSSILFLTIRNIPTSAYDLNDLEKVCVKTIYGIKDLYRSIDLIIDMSKCTSSSTEDLSNWLDVINHSIVPSVNFLGIVVNKHLSKEEIRKISETSHVELFDSLFEAINLISVIRS